MKKNSGFTLVELAIVLVIVGLIVGGVLVGASLIRNAEVRAIMNERSTIETAINTFRVRYNELPGDMAKATKIWGAADPVPATCITIDSGDKRTCDGNGNKRIFDVQSSDPLDASEMFRVWQHLSNAELVHGSFNGIPGPVGSYDYVPGVNTLISKVQGGYWHLQYVGYMSAASAIASPWMYEGNYAQLMAFGTLRVVAGLGNIPFGPVLQVTEVKSLDLKMDDGKPGTGILRVFAPATGTPFENTCATSGDYATAVYSSDEKSECGLMFKLKLG